MKNLVKFMPFGIIPFISFVVFKYGLKICIDKIFNIFILSLLLLFAAVLYVVYLVKPKKHLIKAIEGLLSIFLFLFFYACNIHINLIFTSPRFIFHADSQFINVCFSFKNMLRYHIPDAESRLEINGSLADESKGRIQRDNWGIAYFRDSNSPFPYGTYDSKVILESMLCGHQENTMNFIVGFEEKFKSLSAQYWHINPCYYKLIPYDCGIILKSSNSSGITMQFQHEFKNNMMIEFTIQQLSDNLEKYSYNIFINFSGHYMLVIGDGNDRRISLKRYVGLDHSKRTLHEIDCATLRDGLAHFKTCHITVMIDVENYLRLNVNVSGAGRVLLSDSISVVQYFADGIRPSFGVTRNVAGIMLKKIRMRNLTDEEILGIEQ